MPSSVKVAEVERVVVPAATGRAMPSVKVVEVSRVVVPAATATPGPGDGSPLYWLSALDAPWLNFPLMQRVFIFEDDGQPRPFASLVASLRESLAATLARFLPLAGRIVFLPSTGDAAIDCSERGVAGGVRFLVAEADDADAGTLSGDADHDVVTFRRLVPGLDVGALPAEVLAVQVTRLRGGVAVGVALHHAVVDGRSAWRFFEAWAAACRGDTADTAAPSFDRAVIALPDGRELARRTLRKYSPHLPLVLQSPVGPIFPRRTFTITEKHIIRLKQRIADIRTAPASTMATMMPSNFVAVAALSWASYIRSKHPSAISADHDVYLFFFLDYRGRGGFDSPLSEGYFGSCITGCIARAIGRDLLAEDGVAAAAMVVQEEVKWAAKNPLAMWDSLKSLKSLPVGRVLNISGSTRFPAYEATNFGWGLPSRTELVSMKNPGQVVLVAAKGDGIQVSAIMHPDHMDTFSSHFVNFLD